MSAPLGVAVVGAGFMGGVHAEVLAAHPRAQLVAVCDLDQRAAQELAGRFAVPTVTDDLDRVLADDRVGLVVVTTPNALHADQAARALRAGRHVLVEKPLALTPDEIHGLLRLATERGLVLAHGSNFVQSPKFRRVRELVADAEAFGTPHLARVVVRNAGPDSGWCLDPALAGGGVLLDLGCHAVEICRWLLGGAEVRAVTARSQRVRRPDGPVEDQAVLLLEFADGALGQCDISWACPGGEEITTEVLGTTGRAGADLWTGMGVDAFSERGFASVWEPNKGWVRPEWEWVRASGYVHQDHAVVEAVLDSVPLPHSPAEAWVSSRILAAAEESAATGRTVELTSTPNGLPLPDAVPGGDRVH
ncbi:Gfo/Idh/MocA family protein [Streptoalloteichus hindustanus]|uniref:Myo-inositol 2-dehydrogenase / D-chiro-inositol 1-dehydrogenase n=2 Tax=Streptoalloteichus hindustanus TaxID=2017 RepID=A0A1M4Z1K3_STRHI|nr:Gfo/Idh/MocA family oxidoreductase [Streptoalloteichus hindustanus]SHF11949.1 myo-inositol 2-dehydrogenase / D-chiro-inositol 1-dehydrogenase [Streptoalloteichus hindustanus]